MVVFLFYYSVCWFVGLNGVEISCGIVYILGILLMDSYDI